METYPTWIRLHPASVDETLAISVQARIHDPLWLLGRQWQFGELRHDGGATPIDVRVEGTTAPLARMRGGGADVTTGRSAAIKPTGTPLEALVEREAVRETGLEQLRLRAEAGLHLLRMLRAAGLPGARVAFWIAEGAFVLPADAVLDDEGREWWDMVEGRIPDGGRLPAAIRARLAAGATPPIDPPEATVLRAWLSWAGDRFEQPASGPSTWSPEHMEYAFSVAGLGASGEVLLTAPEYTEGRLEWYHFDQAGERDVGRHRSADGAPRLPRAGTARFRRHAQSPLLDVRGPVGAVRPDRRALQPGRGAVAGDADGPRLRLELQRRLVPAADCARRVVAVRCDGGGRDRRVRRRDDGRASGRPLEPLSIGLERNPRSHSRTCSWPRVRPRRSTVLRSRRCTSSPTKWPTWRGASSGWCRMPPGTPSTPPGQPAPQTAATPTGLVWTLAPPAPPGNWFPLAADHHRSSGARRSVVGAHAAAGGAVARRASRLAPAAASVRGAARGRAGQPALAVGARHRWHAPFLDRSQQDAAPDGHRAGRALRRGRVPQQVASPRIRSPARRHSAARDRAPDLTTVTSCGESSRFRIHRVRVVSLFLP